MDWTASLPGEEAHKPEAAELLELLLHGTGIGALRMQMHQQVGQAQQGMAREQRKECFLLTGERQGEERSHARAFIPCALQALAQLDDSSRALLPGHLHELSGLSL